MKYFSAFSFLILFPFLSFASTLENDLMDAIASNDAVLVQKLIKDGASINPSSTSYTYGYTPLIEAAGFGYNDIVQILIDNGALINIGSKLHKLTPITRAAKKNHLTTVKLLLENGAIADMTAGKTNNGYDCTALAHSINNKNIEMAQLLLDHAANINKRCGEDSMLSIAIKNKASKKFIDLIIDSGFKPCWKLKLGVFCKTYNYLQLSVQNYPENTVPILDKIISFYEKQDIPVKPSKLDRMIRGVLEALSARSDSIELADFLFSRSSSENLLQSAALRTAIENNNVAFATYLLQKGFDPNKTVNKPSTTKNYLITLAAKYNFTNMVRLLLQFNANPNLRGEYGDTPILFAAEYANEEMATDLLNYGAELIVRPTSISVTQPYERFLITMRKARKLNTKEFNFSLFRKLVSNKNSTSVLENLPYINCRKDEFRYCPEKVIHLVKPTKELTVQLARILINEYQATPTPNLLAKSVYNDHDFLATALIRDYGVSFNKYETVYFDSVLKKLWTFDVSEPETAEYAETLIKNGELDINDDIGYPGVPFLSGVLEDQVKLDFYLSLGADPKEFNSYRFFDSVENASISNKLEGLKKLFLLGASISIGKAIEYGYTSGRYENIDAILELLDFLAQNGADLNSGSIQVLMNYVKDDDLRYLNLFVKYNVDLDLTEAEGNDRPLLIAMERNQFEVFKFLLESGANPRITNKEGLSLIDVAIDDSKNKYVKLLVEYL